jgi:hypothetical protein
MQYTAKVQHLVGKLEEPFKYAWERKVPALVVS